MDTMHIDDGTRAGIAFVGRSLGPFFRLDPQRDMDAILPSYTAVLQMNAQEAAAEWPFVEPRAAFQAICLMQEGLEDDFDERGIIHEYRRLFVGPGHKAAAPWGSVYTDKDGVMFGASWVALRAWMRENGVSVGARDANEPEDHIGLMLELMAWLADERPGLLPEFLSLHLLPWAGHFLEGMRDVSQHAFFEGLATLAKASLDGIQDALELEVKIPRFYR